MYGFGKPFAVTSWGGNAILDNGEFHLFVTEIQGKTCGLGLWQHQSTVTHATSATALGPYAKQSTAVQHQAHNPEAIRFNGEWYIFHIGTGANDTAIKDCKNTNNVPHTRAHAYTALASAADHCPPAPTGYTSHPGHCVGPDASQMDCAIGGNGQITHGNCGQLGASDLSTCLAKVSVVCDANSDCHSIALETSCGSVTGARVGQNQTQANSKAQRAPASIGYKLFTLGASSLTATNTQWAAFTKPGHGPVPPPSPPSPPQPRSDIGHIHKSTSGPGGPFVPVGAPGVPWPNFIVPPCACMFWLIAVFDLLSIGHAG